MKNRKPFTFVGILVTLALSVLSLTWIASIQRIFNLEHLVELLIQNHLKR